MTIVIFDTETGGTDPRHPTIQIGAIAVNDDWQEIDSFTRNIAFLREQCSEEALSMNAYAKSPQDWDGAKSIGFVVGEFQSFLSRHATVRKQSKRTNRDYYVAALCGHNASDFDFPRLQADFSGAGMFLPAGFDVLDSMHLYRWLKRVKPMPDSGRLTDIAKHYGVPIDGAHDALADCRIVAAVVPLMLKDMKE